MKKKILLLAFISMAFAASCAGTVRSTFQIHENPLTDVVRERTRTVKLYSQFDTILILDGVLYDMAVRRSRVEQEAGSKRLGAEEITSALKPEVAEDSASAQFVLALYTYKEEWNDLAEKNSRWSIFLDTASGPVRPSSITKVERDKLDLRDNLPFDPNFRRFYIVKFPREKAVGAPYRLMMSGLLGEVSLTWNK